MDGRHAHVLKTSAGIAAEGLGELACIIVVVESSVSFGFSHSRPISSEESD